VILATTLLALAPALPAQEASSQGPVWAFQPTQVVMPDGSTAEGLTVLVQDGRILGVGADLELPSGARRWKLDGVLAPGFVDAFSAYGTDQAAQEDSRALTPMLRAFDAVDLASDDWKTLIKAGVTSVQVLPEPNNIQAGWGALVTSAGESRMLAGRTRQVLSLVLSRVSDSAFGPSSLVGAIELLGKANSARIPGVADRGVLAHVDDTAAIRAVRAALGKDIQTSWMMWGDPASYGGELKGQLAGMPIPGIGAWTPRGLETLKRLHKAGVKICFGTWSPSGARQPGDLRRAAATMSRLTGDSKAAMAAITSHAAAFVGSDQIGAIEKGRRADLVLWSAHPLDPSAKILSVLINGEAAFRASDSE
jgi:imidazolonepropionase-like amidohydrolase